MPNSNAHPDYIPRRLTRIDRDGNRQELVDSALIDRAPPMVILGEPGMGKTWLLERLAREKSSWQFIRAGSLVRNPSRVLSLGKEQTLVIDALDEVAALQEGDPLHNVLRTLGTIGYPPFILSCRAADWRSASAKIDITEDYETAPEEWTLEPITSEEARNFIQHSGVNPEQATHLIEQLDHKNLAELYGNPLTLDLLAGVVSRQDYNLPETRADLFAQATDVLRIEPNPRYADSALAQLAKEIALDAAGAAMAALLLTGKDAITLKQTSADNSDNVPVAEVTALPGGKHAQALLRSRLFRANELGGGRFVPLHRTIAEYLGARWLAKLVSGNSQTQARLFSLMTADGLVPASLRGLHAWLAHWDTELAETVITNDPFGLLRYGDADEIDAKQGKQLLTALQRLEEEYPYFRAGDWASYSARGLTHPQLTEAMRTAITSQSTGFQLRTLLLEAIRGTQMAAALGADLVALVRDTLRTYAERFDAGEALASASGFKTDWPRLIDELLDETDGDSSRLAVDLMCLVGIEKFSEKSIANAVLAAVGFPGLARPKKRNVIGGGLYSLPRAIPDKRLASVLDCLTDEVVARLAIEDLDRVSWEVRYELNRFSCELIVRWIEQGIDEPLRLWRWLDALARQDGYDDERCKEITVFLRTHSQARIAIQRHILFSVDVETQKRGDFYRAIDLSPGLMLQPDDIIVHLQWISERNERSDRFREAWRTLIFASRRKEGIPENVRVIAAPYASGDDELTNVLDPKPSLEGLEWKKREKKWKAKRKRREMNKKRSWHKQRTEYAAHEDELRAGQLRWVASPAKAYFGCFSDIDTEKDPPDRIDEWLGPDLTQAALAGFEATLFRDDIPTPAQVASSYSEGKYWHYIHPIMAGLAERWRKQRGFADIPPDVILSGCLGIGGELIELEGFEDALVAQIRTDPRAFETYLRTWFEPHLSSGRSHITGLYKLVRDASYHPLSTMLAAEWLERFPNLPPEIEEGLVYCLASAPAAERNFAWGALKTLAKERRQAMFLTDEREYLWQSVCFLVDFDDNAEWLNSDGVLKPEFLWSIRSIISYERGGGHLPVPVSARQFAWIIQSFRKRWPRTDRPSGITSGDINPWDATQFLEWAIYRLADEISDHGAKLLSSLHRAPADSYTTQLRNAVADQRRSRMEAAFEPASLTELSAALNNAPPCTAIEVQAIVLDKIALLQKKIRGSATNTLERFYDDTGKPRTENDCRDLLLDLLEPLPFGIQTSPEEAMPRRTRADISFRLRAVKVPLEAKGQWHRGVWQAASSQLGQFYSQDYQAAGRGIYLVFWFGRDAPPGKRLKRPPNGSPSPETPGQMKTMLERRIRPGFRDSIAVYVLDLTKETKGK